MKEIHIIWGELAATTYKRGIIDNTVRLAHSCYYFNTEAESNAFLYGIKESLKEHQFAVASRLSDIRSLWMPLQTKIVEAVLNGDVKKVTEMLDAGVSPDTKAPNGMTLLQISADRGQDVIAEKLLDHGAKVEDSDGILNTYSAIHLASKSRYDSSTRVIDLLAESGTNLNPLDYDGKTPLMKALEASRLDNALKLLENGAKVHLMDKNGKTARDYFEEKFGDDGDYPLKDKFETLLHQSEKEFIENNERRTSFIRTPYLKPNPYN